MYSTPYIDHLYVSQNCTPVILPGTSISSRRPSQFIPALVGAAETGDKVTVFPAYNALLATLLPEATPLEISDPWSALTASLGTTDDAATIANNALFVQLNAQFAADANMGLVSNVTGTTDAIEALATALTAPTGVALFAPLTLDTLLDWGETADDVFAATQACIEAAGAVQDTATGGDELETVQDATTSLAATDALLVRILAWVNANAGASGALTDTGAPFATLAAWATAQGVP